MCVRANSPGGDKLLLLLLLLLHVGCRNHAVVVGALAVGLGVAKESWIEATSGLACHGTRRVRNNATVHCFQYYDKTTA